MLKIRKNKIFNYILVITVAFIILLTDVDAATITVHYNGNSRVDTYNYTNTYMKSVHNVVGFNNVGNASVFTQLQNSVIFIAHNHGAPGLQMLGDSTGIVGTNGNESTFKSISSLSVGIGKPLYLAIYYGCSTGVATSSYGDIVSYTTSRIAKSAIAWTDTTYTNHVNTWNKYFFDKGRKTSSTGATALTYADTSLATELGSSAVAIMKNKRVTSGSFTWTFASMLYA